MKHFLLPALLLMLAPLTALADEAPLVNGANTAWILTSTALVLFMTLPGLALFYGGLVKSRNVLSILMRSPRYRLFQKNIAIPMPITGWLA